MQLTSIHRSFGAFLGLLISAILLSTWNHGSTSPLAKRQVLTDDTLLTNPSTSIADQLFDTHDYTLNSSDTPIINKRARTLTFDQARCRGEKLYQIIQNAADGKLPPAKEYGENDINNGWDKQTLFRSIPEGFEAAFKAIGRDIYPATIGDRLPTSDETKGINLEQNKDFVNAAGKKQT
ncbi:MAG: hypothetical protein Q9168_005215, partial [Polycauliona sp. 1 TL-2023]